jgi:Putative Ig domain
MATVLGDPPARGADDHDRGALQRNGRRVLLLRQPVRQRWGPALYLVGGRRGALPPGLELPKRENTISGTPTTAGTFTFTVRVTDDLGAFSEKEFSITIS